VRDFGSSRGGDFVGVAGMLDIEGRLLLVKKRKQQSQFHYLSALSSQLNSRISSHRLRRTTLNWNDCARKSPSFGTELLLRCIRDEPWNATTTTTTTKKKKKHEDDASNFNSIDYGGGAAAFNFDPMTG